VEEKKRHILKPEQKALNINLNKQIYGTFAEIGAGQEVARNFFQAGAAVGTIAKTMSAYDKTYSDSIYGEEKSGRYVCESRLYKMLDHEYSLMQERLSAVRPDSSFFVFADTVAAINYKRTILGQGWLGVRFQLTPDGPSNDLIIHVRLKDQSNHLQQEAIGILGVNMIYACYKFTEDLDEFVLSLQDSIWGRVQIDMIRLEGPDFDHVDNRILTLKTVKHGLTDVAMFNKEGRSVHASEFLWKRDLMVVRGHFRPPTKVTQDVFDSGFKQFVAEEDVSADRASIMAELTMKNLTVKGGSINEADYLERADTLCALGYDVIISNCDNHQVLVNYLSDLNIGNLGLVIGVKELYQIIDDKYHNNQDGRLLVAFGELFNKNITVYVYPAYLRKGKELVSAKTLIVPDGIHFLYKHLIETGQIVEIENYNKEQLDIMPWNILDSIKSGEEWEHCVPAPVVEVIKEKSLFNYKSNKTTLA
jgi:hypothetical protein